MGLFQKELNEDLKQVFNLEFMNFWVLSYYNCFNIIGFLYNPIYFILCISTYYSEKESIGFIKLTKESIIHKKKLRTTDLKAHLTRIPIPGDWTSLVCMARQLNNKQEHRKRGQDQGQKEYSGYWEAKEY